MYVLRPYQKEAVKAALSFFESSERYNGIIVLPTGSGKSLVIASITARLNAPVIVFQPSKEILEQNYTKYKTYSDDSSAGIFSASFGKKQIRRVTFATIGSIKRYAEYFKNFRYVIVDECHYVNPEKGMYKLFFDCIGCKILGLTATPYRLTSVRARGGYYSMLEFLTRTKPKVFQSVLYSVQVGALHRMGYLAHLNYYRLDIVDQKRLRVNKNGADFTEQSIKAYYKEIKFNETLERIVRSLLAAGRKNVLVFTKFVEEAKSLCRNFEGQCRCVNGDTTSRDRKCILEGFKGGRIKVVANVGVLTTGFDYPELSTIVIARPTMSLALYYQMVGRAIRPYEGKTAWIVDLCGNYSRFGKVEDFELRKDKVGKPAFFNGSKQLTNVYFRK